MQTYLYHHRLSFSSQIVRLAAAELEVDLGLIEIDIGPAHENYSPWYFAINRKGVVPSIVFQGGYPHESAVHFFATFVVQDAWQEPPASIGDGGFGVDVGMTN